MKLEGDLTELRLLPHLIELAEARFTGAIRFENDGIIKILYFKEGDVLSASTNDRSDSIDEILLRAGKVTRDHVRQALGRRKENETLGDALLALGFIARKELTWARRVQVVGIIRSVLAWNAGSFQIVQDYLPKREEGTLFYLPQILLELIVTEPDRSRIEQALDGGEAVLYKTPQFDERYGKLALNEDADAIVRQIDGERTAAEIAAATQLEAFAVYKLLVALETLGLVAQRKVQVMDELSLGRAAAEDAIFDTAVEPLPSSDFGAVPASMIPAEEAPRLEPEIEAQPAWEPEGGSFEEERAAIPAADDPFLRRRSGRNSMLLLVSLLVVLALGAWGGYRWWASTGVANADESPATPMRPAVTETADAAAPADTIEDPIDMSPLPATGTAAAAEPAAPVVEPSDPLRRQYQALAEDYARTGRNVAYAVQFEIVCQTESVTRAIAAGERVWFAPISYRGQPCFRVFWGRYATREAAQAAIGEIPAELRGSSPVIVQPREVLR
ncbi:MAG: DUF4388 domain-containing protein [Thermoanaerobaculia bacterium]